MDSTEEVRLEFFSDSGEAPAVLSQGLLAWLRADPELAGLHMKRYAADPEGASLRVALPSGDVVTAFVRALAAWVKAHRPGSFTMEISTSRGTAELASGAGGTETGPDLAGVLIGTMTVGIRSSGKGFWDSLGRLLNVPVNIPDFEAIVAAARIGSGNPGDHGPDAGTIPITVYLSDRGIHQGVEDAVEELLATAGLRIENRDEPIVGSWFRRMRATAKEAANSPAAREAALIAAHVAETRVVLSRDAAVTATLLQNLGPVLGALQPTKDAVIRAGALLIVKVNWEVHVFQLTAAQQALLDLSPRLPRSPREIITALNLTAEDHQDGHVELT